MTCKKCGSTMQEDDQFCSSCGERFQQKPKKKKTWKRVIVAVATIIAITLIGTITYFAVCYSTGKAYFIEKSDDGGQYEYYYGNSLSKKLRVYVDENGVIKHTRDTEEKIIDGKKYAIVTYWDYYYDENGMFDHKRGSIIDEPGIYKHNVELDADDNYLSDEIWYRTKGDFTTDQYQEFLVKDSIEGTTITRKYECHTYKSNDDEPDYDVMDGRIILANGGAFSSEDEEGYDFVVRLLEEEFSWDVHENVDYISTFEYKKDMIIEKEVDTIDGDVTITKYDYSLEEIDSYCMED